MIESSNFFNKNQFLLDRIALNQLVNEKFFSENGEVPISEYLENFSVIYERFFSVYLLSYVKLVFSEKELITCISELKTSSLKFKTKEEIFQGFNFSEQKINFLQSDYDLLFKIWNFFTLDYKNFFLIKKINETTKYIKDQTKDIERYKNIDYTNVTPNPPDYYLWQLNQSFAFFINLLIARYSLVKFLKQLEEKTEFKEDLFRQILAIDSFLLLLVFALIKFKQSYCGVFIQNEKGEEKQ